MDFITIVLFFFYTFGLGFSATLFMKNSDDFFERNLMRIGIGLGILPILGALLNLFHIPIDWKVFLVLSLILPVYYIIKNKKVNLPQLKLTKTNLNILIVLILFLFTFYMYHTGAFSYEYLEDDDPWHHAQSAKYVSITKTAYEAEGFNVLSFVDPYPPAYAIIMGILDQTSDSISWVLKFFNALIISLGIIFFYFFLKNFSGNKNKALFSTFVLAAVPAYLSHFIWSHALIIILMFPAFYALEQIKIDKKWLYISMLIIGSILITQPTQALKFVILFGIYFIVKSITEKKLNLQVFLSGLFGFILSFLWWGPMMAKYGGLKGLLAKMGLAGVSAGVAAEKGIIGVLGTATRKYTFSDFFFAKKVNLINNPIGIGIFLTILGIISFIYVLLSYKSLLDRKNSWKLITLLWLIFAFVGIHGGTRFPIALFSFRFWMLFSIPLAIISAEGLWFLNAIAKKIRISKFIIIGLIVIGVIFTSAYQKYYHNTNPGWPGGATWVYMQDPSGRVFSPELEGYLWLKSLPEDTKVYTFTIERSYYIIGMDKLQCLWCKDEMDYQKNAFDKAPEELNKWLKSKNYEYITIGANEVRAFGINEATEKINELTSSGLFNPVHQNQGVVIMKVV